MNYKLIFTVSLASTLLFVSCKDDKNYSKMEKTPVQLQTQNNIHEIVVKDVIEAGTYVYLQVEENGNIYWMAIPNTSVEKGATFYYTGGMLMKDFKSEQLNKTFDEIVFVEGISNSKNTANKPMVNPHAAGEFTKPSVAEISISQPSDGISIEEIFANKESLKNKEVIVKGKVVKVNNGILDRNWVHIADGTSFGDKTDITVTTSQVIKVGETLTFKGTLVLDKDFGSGYIYGLLLENGVVINE